MIEVTMCDLTAAEAFDCIIGSMAQARKRAIQLNTEVAV